MVISDKYKFIFFHIHKNAGTTIDQALDDYYDHWPILADKIGYPDKKKTYQGSFNGLNLDCTRYRQLLSIDEGYRKLVEDYFCFTFVRNPYDRHFSFYNMQVRRGHIDKIPFAKFRKEYPQQIDYLPSLSNVDFIGRVENFDLDILKLKNYLGNDFEHVNFDPKNTNSDTGKFYRYLEKYNKDTVDFVNNAYRKDFEKFNYDLLSPDDFSI